MSAQLLTDAGRREPSTATWIVGVLAAVALWFAIYWRLEAFSAWVASLLPIVAGSHPKTPPASLPSKLPKC